MLSDVKMKNIFRVIKCSILNNVLLGRMRDVHLIINQLQVYFVLEYDLTIRVFL